MLDRKAPIARRLAVLFLTLALSATWAGLARAGERPFTVRDLVSMDRISDPQVSPDGRHVAYVLRSTDLEANGAKRDIWVVDVLGETEPRRLTTHPATDMEPRWAPDGESLYFLSTRSGSVQVWQLPLGGGEARPITDEPLGVANLVIAPGGDRLAFTMDVFVDCETLACTQERLDERAGAETTGVIYDSIFVRHWDFWKDGRRSHLFVLPLGETGGDAGALDVTAGLDADVPSKPFGDSSEITFTPDGKGLVFAARQAGPGEPRSTNFDLYYAPADGSAPPRVLTDNPAWDTHPAFSPDGKTLSYFAMSRAGFEADRFRIVLREWKDGATLGPPRVVAEEWDRSAGSLAFSADGKTLYVTAQDTGNVPLVAIDVSSGRVTKLVAEGHVRSPGLAGERLVFGHDHLQSPVELYSIALDGGDRRQLTHVNRERLEGVAMGAYEQFSFEGANGDTVYGYLVEPADREAATAGGAKVPIAFLIHGGPQGSFDNDFHYRWNPQTYAGAGYAAVMIDFHGSTGYGQAFTDAIRDDWGGKPLEDLRKGLAAALERYPWLDGDRVCALGASYGGYMINWIAGNWPDRFRCLVNHDGLFDVRSMYYATEELWFPEWEFRGPPYANPEAYARNNPALHVDRWQTPMLVVHGQLDYRVPLTQGLATFTALQRRGIPSRFLYYPDENHWVLKPRNSIQWHETVLAWLDRWLRSGGEE